METTLKQEWVVPKYFDMDDVGEYYYHNKVTLGREEDPLFIGGSAAVHDQHICMSWTMEKIKEWYPGFGMFFANQQEITDYPLEFVKSDRYTPAVKVFHMTIGSIFVGFAQSIHHTIGIIKYVACAIFFTIKSIWDLETRKNLMTDFKASIKDIKYHANMLVKSLVQLVPGAGIFLPSLYDTTTSKIASETEQGMSVINEKLRIGNHQEEPAEREVKRKRHVTFDLNHEADKEREFTPRTTVHEATKGSARMVIYEISPTETIVSC